MIGRFGRYREIAQLGHGGMARIILAALPGAASVQKLVVIKEILPDLAHDAEFVGMFADEARIATRLDHPNLVHTYEFAEADGKYFSVMEYLDGQSLDALLSRTQRRIPLALHLRILTRVLAGLHYAHELCDLDGRPLDIVHRDVSPDNVIVCYGGAIKLVDFGIAKATGAAMKTRSGVFKGKIAYASPEQLANEPIDRRSDIFAVGAMLWEALVGERLTKGMNEAAVVARRFRGDVKVSHAKPDVAPELAAVCNVAMAPRPSQRYATAAKMLEDLDLAMEKLQLRATDEEVGAFAASQFTKERSDIRKLLQERLASDRERESSLPIVVVKPPSSSDVGDGAGISSSTTREAPSTEGGTDVTQSLAAPLPTTHRRSKRLIALAATPAMVLGIVAIVLTWKARRGADEGPHVVVAASAPWSGASSAADAAPDLVDVTFSASPPSARFALDDVELEGNPFHAQLPRDHRARRLSTTAEGHRNVERMIVLDRPLHVEVVLQAHDGAGSPRAAPVSPRPAKTAKPIDTRDPYTGAPR